MILNYWIKKKDTIDVGTNGLLKRNIALKIFNNLRFILTLIIIATLTLTLSGSNKFIIEYKEYKLTIPAISREAATTVVSVISMVLGKLLSERDSIISYYFGSTIKNDELEESAGKVNNKQDCPDCK
ncbi:MAG: hypothetical protein NZZ41_01305 [Candidatus Dojkabacteria bacterium]|nr:hypothetical protein [Candidatus Dojkabacteria bacterium]